jgi:signal transduction histidine kinase
MLAEALETARPTVLAEVEQVANATDGLSSRALGRSERLGALLTHLIDTLKRGAVNDQVATLPARNEAVEGREREVLQRYVLDRIAASEYPASARDTAVVGAWPSAVERARLRERIRELMVLLSRVEECAALLGPDGRVLYVNDRAGRLLHAASGVPADELVGKTIEGLALPADFGLPCAPARILSLGRMRQECDTIIAGRAQENQFDAIYAADGSIEAVALVIREVQAQKVAITRLKLLSRISALVGTMEYDEAAEALAHVPVPDLADWCAVSIVEGKQIRQTYIAQRDPALAHVRQALLQLAESVDRHPLWANLFTGGYQLLSEVTDDLIRRLAVGQDVYNTLSQLQIRSLMVMPIVWGAQIVGIITLAYTSESARRYSRDDPGLVEELAVHAADLLETARLMKQLKVSEARFHVALASAGTYVFEQDRALRYRYYYDPVTSTTSVGMTQDDMYPPDEAARLAELKRRVLETGEGVLEEIDLTRSDGERRHYREAVEAMRDGEGRIVGVIGAATDISEEDRARRQLSDMLEVRERMTGVLAHDLRSPLSTIKLSNHALLERGDLPADLRSQVVRTEHAACRMEEMIAVLIDFTQARFHGRIPISPVSVDFGELATGVIEDAKITCPECKIELEVRGDGHGTWDPGRLAEIVSNLLNNALAYGDSKRPVSVIVDGTGEEAVTLSLHNEGPPIPSDVMPVLFEPFRRGTESRSGHGLGLGLYIAQQLVQEHHGTISVKSTVQEGTTLTIDFPRSATNTTAR